MIQEMLLKFEDVFRIQWIDRRYLACAADLVVIPCSVFPSCEPEPTAQAFPQNIWCWSLSTDGNLTVVRFHEYRSLYEFFTLLNRPLGHVTDAKLRSSLDPDLTAIEGVSPFFGNGKVREGGAGQQYANKRENFHSAASNVFATTGTTSASHIFTVALILPLRPSS